MISRLKLLLFMLLDSILVNFAILFVLWNHFPRQALMIWNYPFDELVFGDVGGYLVTGLLNTGILAVCFYFGGLYKRLWQYVGTGEMLSIIKAITIGLLVYGVVLHLISSINLTWNFWAETWMTALFLAGFPRMGRLLIQELRFQFVARSRLKNVLIIGAGDAGALVAKTLLHNKLGLQPMAFIDDDPGKQGMRLYDIPVAGFRTDIPSVAQEYAVEEIVIAIPSAPAETIRQLIEICRNTPARIKIVPGVVKLLKGTLPPNQIRDIQVEDLLQREPIHMDLEQIAAYLRGQVVLVTGAGGSIGSELCRQIIAFKPRQLILLGHGENSIYELHRELAAQNTQGIVQAVIADIRDYQRILSIFQDYRPAVVFHAAAHKHVPLMEAAPEEAFQNNVLGTLNVSRAADLAGTKRFVLISTDKAVKPSSIMGASKRLAELVVQRMNELSQTNYVIVRFGNVLGSRGSVLPLFQQQIEVGGPVTVTHPEMYRYFMTVPEAVQLVIQAGSMAEGGETYVLDMGEPVKILDLAKALIDISGMKDQVEIVFTGPRPGEKLREELFTPEEGAVVSKHKRIFITQYKQELTDLINNLISDSLTSFSSSPQDALNLLKQVMGDQT